MSLVYYRCREGTVMIVKLNLLVHPGDRERLLQIAEQLDTIAPTGPRSQQPSISALIKQIAAGEIILHRRRK